VMWGPADMGPGVTYFILNIGPNNVRGGRHTLEILHDDQNFVVESNENDNAWAHQFIFTPYMLTSSVAVTRGPPPEIFGGTSSIVDGSIIDYNSDGFRFSSSGWWNVVAMYSMGLEDDYDLGIYSPSTGSENGFTGALYRSYLLAGYLDAVIVNGNTVGTQDYDVGVNKFGGSSNFVIEHLISDPAWVGTDMTVSFGTDEYLKIWDTFIGDTGWVTVAVTDSINSGVEFQVGWLEHDVTVTNLSAASWQAMTDARGEIRLHKNFSTVGYYGLVLYRNPSEGGFPVDLTLRIEPTPPDLVPAALPAWHSQLVPTPVPMGGGMWPELPDTLHGYMPQTYFNLGLLNDSNISSPPVDTGVFFDDVTDSRVSYQFQAMGSLDLVGINDSSAKEIPGGRHTMMVEVDDSKSIHEIYETNNIIGEQYCWSPLELSLGWQNSREAPGPDSGGFWSLSGAEPFYYNCDGYRLYTGYSEWEGLVLTQGPNSDYDLSIHQALDGVKDGFDDYLAVSVFLAEETDYVLFNNQLLPAVAHDVGVENLLGDEVYTIEAVGSTNLPVPVGGFYGPFTMPISNMLHLHNIYLVQDIYAFRLDNLGLPVDWGFALHPSDQAYQGRHDAMIDASSYLAGPGDPEWFTVDVPVAGWYGLAVFKATPYGFDVEGEYQLTILQGVSDVQDQPDLPSATALAGVHPNPFNPQTTISYELASSAAVDLCIYDLKGALVRRLVSEPMPAGRHQAVWNGRDDIGRRVASGTYLYRLEAGEYSETRRMALIK
jgi:hypothetical protein